MYFPLTLFSETAEAFLLKQKSLRQTPGIRNFNLEQLNFDSYKQVKTGSYNEKCWATFTVHSAPSCAINSHRQTDIHTLHRHKHTYMKFHQCEYGIPALFTSA